MGNAQNIKDKLRNGKTVIGAWLTIGHTTIADLMSRQDVDFVCIDMEHTPIDFTLSQNMIITIQGNKKAALVRVGKNDEVLIKKALDSGADGIIVPMIKNADEVKEALSYAYYPPRGNRGVGLVRANGYSTRFNEYKKDQPENILFVAQIEHKDAVKNLRQIAEVPGVDATIIGPYDLSGSMGFPGDFDNQDVVNALSEYDSICEEKKMPKGYHVVEPDADLVNQKISENYQFIAFGVDFMFILKKMEKEIKKIIR